MHIYNIFTHSELMAPAPADPAEPSEGEPEAAAPEAAEPSEAERLEECSRWLSIDECRTKVQQQVMDEGSADSLEECSRWRPVDECRDVLREEAREQQVKEEVSLYLKVLDEDPDPKARKEAVGELWRRSEDPRVVPALTRALLGDKKDPDPDVRIAIIEEMPGKTTGAFIQILHKDPDSRVRLAAANELRWDYLHSDQRQQILTAFITALSQEPEESVRVGIVKSLTNAVTSTNYYTYKEEMKQVTAALRQRRDEDSSPKVRDTSVEALKKLRRAKVADVKYLGGGPFGFIDGGGHHPTKTGSNGFFNLTVGGFLSVGGDVARGFLAAGFRYGLITQPLDQVSRQVMGAKVALGTSIGPVFLEAGPVPQVELGSKKFLPGFEGSVNSLIPFPFIGFLPVGLGVVVGSQDLREKGATDLYAGIRLTGAWDFYHSKLGLRPSLFN